MRCGAPPRPRSTFRSPDRDATSSCSSNRFSKLASKKVTSDLALIWEDDPSLPTGEELRRQATFLDVSPISTGWRFRRRPPTRSPRSSSSAGPAICSLSTCAARCHPRRSPSDPGPARSKRSARSTCTLTGTGCSAGRRRAGFERRAPRPGAGLPRQLASLTLSLVWPRGAMAETARYGETYSQARFAAEQSFLERIWPAFTGAPPPWNVPAPGPKR